MTEIWSESVKICQELCSKYKQKINNIKLLKWLNQLVQHGGWWYQIWPSIPYTIIVWKSIIILSFWIEHSQILNALVNMFQFYNGEIFPPCILKNVQYCIYGQIDVEKVSNGGGKKVKNFVPCRFIWLWDSSWVKF